MCVSLSVSLIPCVQRRNALSECEICVCACLSMSVCTFVVLCLCVYCLYVFSLCMLISMCGLCVYDSVDVCVYECWCVRVGAGDHTLMKVYES